LEKKEKNFIATDLYSIAHMRLMCSPSLHPYIHFLDHFSCVESHGCCSPSHPSWTVASPL